MKKFLKDIKGELEEARFASDRNWNRSFRRKINFENFKQILDNTFYQDDLIGDEVGIPLYFPWKSC